ncbi:hypothetical protein [Dolichospermum compactum]|nr:hypothetical protein [Dolichospermum compactum]
MIDLVHHVTPKTVNSVMQIILYCVSAKSAYLEKFPKKAIA